MQKKNLFEERLVVINIGVSLFAENLKAQGVQVGQVLWRPPIDKEILNLLRKVL